MTAEKLRKLNPDLKIYTTADAEFAEFGVKITDIDTCDIIKSAEQIKMPEVSTIYEASNETFEKLNIKNEIVEKCYGGLDAQIGYCYGHSNYMNAFEWHTSSEINVAITDLVLILGNRAELQDNKIDSSKAKIFYIKKGEAIEVFATSLHFCPCEVEKTGFGCVVALPRGTNTPLEKKADNPLLFRKNKWIICHNENKELIERGVVPGISGTNIEIKY